MTIALLALVLRVAGYVPLLAYPAVLIANAMQTSALLDPKLRSDVAAARRALMSLFVGGTTLYPLVVLASGALATNAADEARIGMERGATGIFVRVGGILRAVGKERPSRVKLWEA